MTLALEIITDAHRETNLVAVGQTLSSDQASEGLRRLRGVISSALGFEVGEGLTDWVVGPSEDIEMTAGIWCRPPQNTNLIINGALLETVTFPANPNPGARMRVTVGTRNVVTYPLTIAPTDRLIDGEASVVIDDNDFSATWFYRDDLSQWIKATDLATNSDMPFPADFDDYFTTRLAMRLNPRYGRALTQETAAELNRMERILRARYKQSRAVTCEVDYRFNTLTGFRRPFGAL